MRGYQPPVKYLSSVREGGGGTQELSGEGVLMVMMEFDARVIMHDVRNGQREHFDWRFALVSTLLSLHSFTRGFRKN